MPSDSPLYHVEEQQWVPLDYWKKRSLYHASLTVLELRWRQRPKPTNLHRNLIYHRKKQPHQLFHAIYFSLIGMHHPKVKSQLMHQAHQIRFRSLIPPIKFYLPLNISHALCQPQEPLPVDAIREKPGEARNERRAIRFNHQAPLTLRSPHQ